MNSSSPGSLLLAEHHDEQHPQLSPSALKRYDRFGHLTGFSRVIIHALGHAVVAAYLGHPLELVSIEHHGGACLCCREVLGQNAFTANQAVVSHAGLVAVVMALHGERLTDLERACSTGEYQDEYGIDWWNLRACARFLNFAGAARDSWLEDLTPAALDILDLPFIWEALTRLAKELEAKKTLTGGRVCEVLAACKEEVEATA